MEIIPPNTDANPLTVQANILTQLGSGRLALVYDTATNRCQLVPAQNGKPMATK